MASKSYRKNGVKKEYNERSYIHLSEITHPSGSGFEESIKNTRVRNNRTNVFLNELDHDQLELEMELSENVFLDNVYEEW